MNVSRPDDNRRGNRAPSAPDKTPQGSPTNLTPGKCAACEQMETDYLRVHGRDAYDLIRRLSADQGTEPWWCGECGPRWVPWGSIPVDSCRLLMCDPMHIGNRITGDDFADWTPRDTITVAGVDLAQMVNVPEGLYPLELLLDDDAKVIELRVRFTNNTQGVAS